MGTSASVFWFFIAIPRLMSDYRGYPGTTAPATSRSRTRATRRRRGRVPQVPWLLPPAVQRRITGVIPTVDRGEQERHGIRSAAAGSPADPAKQGCDAVLSTPFRLSVSVYRRLFAAEIGSCRHGRL